MGRLMSAHVATAFRLASGPEINFGGEGRCDLLEGVDVVGVTYARPTPRDEERLAQSFSLHLYLKLMSARMV